MKNESTAFEEQFSNIAHDVLQDTLPELTPYNLGFEITETNDAQTEVKGVFAFLINGKHYLVPVIFINNELKPLILMYDKEENVMLPLNSDFLAYIKKQKVPSMGKGVNVDRARIPAYNMRNIMVYPFTDKYASTRFKEGIDPDFNLMTVIAKSPMKTKKAFIDLCSKNKELTKECLDTYGEDVMSMALECNTEKRASQKKTFEIIDHDSHIEKVANLKKEEKASLEHTGYLVRDCRPKEELNKTYTAKYYTNNYSSPIRDGIYKIMTNLGEIDAAVFLKPYYLTHNRIAKSTAIVVDVKTRKWTICDPASIILKTNEVWDFSDDLFMTLHKIHGNNDKSMHYVLYEDLPDRDRVYEPFRLVRKKTRTPKGSFFTVAPNYDFRGHDLGCKEFGQSDTGSDMAYERSLDEVVLWTKNSGRISRVGIDLYVPRDTKVFSLREMELVIFGIADVDNFTFGAYHIVKTSGENLMIDGKVVSRYNDRVDAINDLAVNYNIYGPAAQHYVETGEEFLIEKEANTPFFYYANTDADGFTSAPGGEHTFQADEFPVGTLGAFDAINTQMVKEIDSNEVENEIQKALELSRSGVKKVFDHSLIGSLSKMTDISSVLKSYIPNFMKSIDSLGRMIFHLWDKYDMFKNHFSLNEISEFEQLLKDVFSGLGEVVIHIESKDIGQEDSVKGMRKSSSDYTQTEVASQKKTQGLRL